MTGSRAPAASSYGSALSVPSRDAAWWDRMYDNRARVPEHPAYLQRWASDSAQVRRTADAVLDRRYGTHPSMTLDVFRSPVPRAPVVVFVHGGYWRSLDKSDHSFIAPALTRAGLCVVVPNYALCPAVTIPQIALQMVQALAWTWRHVGEFGGDPGRITMVGHSAGGHLVSLLLNCDWPAWASDLPARLACRALSISGLFDLEPMRRAPSFQASLRLTPHQVRRASPLRMPAPRGATLYGVVGAAETDEFLRQNRAIRQAWGERAVPVCEAMAGLNHFSILDALVAPEHRLHRLLLRLAAL